MRAAVLRETGLPRPFAHSHPLAIEEVQLTGPGVGQVLVRMASAGLCHSDLSFINGTRSKPLPAVAGHEGAGVVVEVGPEVDNLQVDDHVVMVFVSSCGRCRACLSGRPALCSESWANRSTGALSDGTRHLSVGGESLNHTSGISAFAEYAVVSRNSVIRIDPAVPLLDAAVFGCAVITGVGSVLNTAAVREGDDVAVVGLGGIGLSAVMGARVAGAGRIAVVDPAPAKRELALELGATLAVDPMDEDAVARVREHTDGGVDHAFEMAGAPVSATSAYTMLRRGGSLVITALPNPTVTLDLPIAALVSDGHSVLGSYMGGSIPTRDIPHYVDLYLAGKLPVDRLRSRTIRLDEINKGFDRLAAGEAVREVIDLEAAR
jgi:alcohol dehydrogenase